LIYRFAAFEVDDAEFRLAEDGSTVALEPKALRLLIYFVKKPGRLISKQELLDAVWSDANVSDNALTRAVTLLRKVLDDSSREPRFIETVPTAGYRFVSVVQAIESSSDGVVTVFDSFLAVEGTVKKISTSHSRRRFPRRVAIILGGVLALSAVLGWRLNGRLHAKTTIHSIAVLPLENLSGDPSMDYFAEGTTDELITELARVPNLRVISSNSAMQEKGSQKPLRLLADDLHADAVVEGSVVVSGDRVRINAKLVDVREDSNIWSSSYEGNVGDIVLLEDSVAREIASHARLASLPPVRGAPASSREVQPAAHDAYLRGLYYYDRRDSLKSAAYFQQAVDLDPVYSSAYAGLATALTSQALGGAVRVDVVPRATAAAFKAIELDPNNGEAYIALGTIQESVTWDMDGAERNLLHGIELNPNSSSGLMMYAIHLDSMNHPESAIAYVRRARDIDPLSFFVARMYGSVLYYGRHYDEALQQLQNLEEAQPNAPNVVENWISWIYEKKGMHDEAVAHDLIYVRKENSGVDVDALRRQYESGGWKAYWQSRLAVLDPKTANGCKLYDVGVAYLRLGERDRAISSLEGATHQQCVWIAMARVDPLLDDLRNDSRYNEILRLAHLTTVDQ
jgi:TolB-like protein/DNA-binding winged helix-turn-helix (wHTH) protein/Tfp pilus assembly protein PilF